MRRVLVTGGAGFIGSHLVEDLVARGADVAVADNLSTGYLANLDAASANIRFEHLDLAAGEIGPLLADGAFDTIFHTAASAYVPTSIEDPERDLQDNIVGTHRLLVAIRQLSHQPMLVNVSTAAVYGEGTGTPMSEAEPTRPVSPYGISKLAAESYVTMYARLFGLRACSVRLFSVFGPRLRKQVVWDFMNRLAANPDELVIYGDGADERDLNHVSNAVDAILMVGERGSTAGDVYNVGSGNSVSIDDLARTLCAVMGVSPALRHTMLGRRGDARRWTSDIRRLRALGFAPSMGYEEGLADTVAWFRAAR